MRHALLSVIATGLLTVLSVEIGSAQRHEVPALTSCIRESYDPGMYNYLTFKNGCTQSLTAVFVAKDGSGRTGTMELRPGAKDSVGKLQGRTPKVGDFEFYVCPSGSMPLDADGKVVTKPGTTFKCQAKSR